ncbi:hypothetical protein ACWF94_09930 [Streptomyces sp. NPDC055078]
MPDSPRQCPYRDHRDLRRAIPAAGARCTHLLRQCQGAGRRDDRTVNRELSIARKAIGWWQRQGWIEGDPTIGIDRHRSAAGAARPHQGPLAENQIAALWRLDIALREETQWKMLYESAARADEVLCLNVEDLYPQDKRGRITAKGGVTEWIHWQSGTAQILPRLIARRTRGPLFLTDRKAPAGTPALDVCPETGRASTRSPGTSPNSTPLHVAAR